MSFLDGLFQRTAPAELVVSPTPVAGDAAIAGGFLYQLAVSGPDVTVTLAASTLAAVSGRRIAVKVISDESEGDPGSVFVAVPDGMVIEGDFGEFGPDAEIELAIVGAYREWLCDNAGRWMLVAGAASDAAVPPASTYEAGGSEEINVAGLDGLLADPQLAGSLDTTGAAVDVSAAAPPTAEQSLIASDATHATWSTGRGERDARAFVFSRRAASLQHADDVDFESTTLPVAFNWYTGALNTVLTPASAYAQGTPDLWGVGFSGSRYAVHTQHRESWMHVQPADGVDHWFIRPITPTANMTLFSRVRNCATNADPGNNTADNKAALYFILCASSGGNPDTRNCIVVVQRYVAAQNFWQINAYSYAASTPTELVGVSPGFLNTRGMPLQAIRKRGNEYGAVIGDESFQVRQLTERSNPFGGGGPAFAGWGWARHEGGGLAEYPIFGWDFMHRRDDLVVPW